MSTLVICKRPESTQVDSVKVVGASVSQLLKKKKKKNPQVLLRTNISLDRNDAYRCQKLVVISSPL